MRVAVVLTILAFLFSFALALPAEHADSDVESKIRACEKECLVTFDFQPRCGSDGVTYNNQRLLECRNTCGKPYGKGVHKVSDGPCPKH
ncbi:hypothetical protein WA026_023263 [Henosepilachna vigintioctopunctata]|uniref:Kazal-like domain-containing protein n=1 Tax=Henosepilachna vigintioctopunctata TaxID=420089 RepID=A0AAW1V3F0_9CUCU